MRRSPRLINSITYGRLMKCAHDSDAQHSCQPHRLSYGTERGKLPLEAVLPSHSHRSAYSSTKAAVVPAIKIGVGPNEGIPLVGT